MSMQSAVDSVDHHSLHSLSCVLFDIRVMNMRELASELPSSCVMIYS